MEQILLLKQGYYRILYRIATFSFSTWQDSILKETSPTMHFESFIDFRDL
jgi:hypothetical protein